MKLGRQSSLVTALLTLTACQWTPPISHGPIPDRQLNAPSAGTAFSASVAPPAASRYTVQSAKALDTVSIDGVTVRLKPGQMLVDAHDEAQIAALARAVGATAVDQMWIWADAPVVTGSKAEGNVRVTPPTRKLYLPCYTLSVPTSDTEDITDLEALGRQARVSGHHVFPSVRVAALYKRLWKAQASFGAAVRSIEANTVGEANGATYEGDPSGGSELCPSGPYYNWARHYTAGYPKGANLNNLTTNERIQNFSTGAGVKVAVIDTGFQNVGESYTPGTVVKGVETEYNAVTGAADVTGTSPGYHGRRVASLIFAPHNDYAGTMGAAENASPYLVHTDVSAEANKRAIEQCRRWGVKVINISWSTTVVQTAFRDALRLATDYDGTIVVSAAGNNGDRLEYPPAHDKVIGVGGHDEYGNKSFFSSATGNYANSLNVDIWAPANYVAVAANTAADRYKINWVEGTSFASPMVAGIVACMVQRGYVTDFTSALNRLQNKGHLYNNLNNSKSLDGIRAIKAY